MVDNAAVAKATLYRHFGSKDELVLAFLERREQLWTKEWVEAEARKRGDTPEQQLLAIFDLFDEWFRRDDFEGCSFVNVLLEMTTARARSAARAPTTSPRSGRSCGRSPRRAASATRTRSRTRGTS